MKAICVIPGKPNSVGVLLEPMSVAEKGIIQAYEIQGTPSRSMLRLQPMR